MPHTIAEPKQDLLTSWEPSEAEPWNAERVVHLHRRAGFGATWGQVQRDLKDGPEASIELLVHPRTTSEDEEFDSLSKMIGDAAASSNNIQRLQAWWLLRMLRTADPLRERLTLMWHNHFATSHTKVASVGLMYEQNELLRKFATGDFATLLSAVVKHPAMAIWLDADTNRKSQPNENLARELLELFALGIDAYQNSTVHEMPSDYDCYTEGDIREIARALTGWRISQQRLVEDSNSHDTGNKEIFGQAGTWTGDDVLRLVAQHPAVPKRIAWRLCQEFLGDQFLGEGDSNAELLAGLAEHLAKSNLDVESAVEKLLRSRAFLSDANIRSKILSPCDFIVTRLRSLEVGQPFSEIPPPSTLALAEWTRRMGQELFLPPNVFGWDGGTDWLTTRSIVHRSNFVSALLGGKLHHPATRIDIASACAKHCSPQEKTRVLQLLLLGSYDEGGQLDLTENSENRASSGAVNTLDERSLNETVRKLLTSAEAHLG